MPKASVDAVWDIIDENVESIDDAEMTPHGDLFDLLLEDTTGLGGGQTEAEVHVALTDEILKIVPGVKVKTYWQELVYEWDHIFDEEDYKKLKEKQDAGTT